MQVEGLYKGPEIPISPEKSINKKKKKKKRKCNIKSNLASCLEVVLL